MAFFSAKASAEELIHVKIAEFPIHINYENFNTETANEMLYYDYQMFLYKDITYFPLSYYNCNLVGITVSLEDNRLIVEKAVSTTASKFKSERLGESVFKKSFKVEKAPFKVLFNGNEYKNEDYPILFYKNITYIPLTWQVVCEIFGWEFSFDENGMLLYTQSHYYTSSGDSYFEKAENYTKSIVSPGKTYYYKDGVRIIAETISNRLGAKSRNLYVKRNELEYCVPGFTGYYQKEGPLFIVEDDYIYTVHYEQMPHENLPCKISINTGEIEYLE